MLAVEMFKLTVAWILALLVTIIRQMLSPEQISTEIITFRNVDDTYIRNKIL